MIYTVTLNPSLDYIVTMKEFALGKTNRTVTERMLPGGKGINVSLVLQNLGIESTVLGFTAGFVGEEIQRKVADAGLRSAFIQIPDGVSRINVKLKDYEGTEINGQGPVVGCLEWNLLMQQLEELQAGDLLVLAGSPAKGMNASSYREIMEKLAGKGILFVVDVSGKALLDVLSCHPFLIKPNNHELGEIFGVELQTRESVIPYAKKMQEMGARNVLVSLAGEGAVLVGDNGAIYQMSVPEGEPINSVGAGDSMVAGFLAGWMEANENGSAGYAHAFRLAVAAGSASAYSEDLATAEEIGALYEKICGEKVERFRRQKE